jgi:hypothetical protein
MDKCAVARCKAPTEIFYYNKPVCEKHWNQHCDDVKKFNLKEVLKIREPKKARTVEIKKEKPKGRTCPSCKDHTIIDVGSKSNGGVKCTRCTYAQYICQKCKRRFKKKFAITNHLRYCKGAK